MDLSILRLADSKYVSSYDRIMYNKYDLQELRRWPQEASRTRKMRGIQAEEGTFAYLVRALI